MRSKPGIQKNNGVTKRHALIMAAVIAVLAGCSNSGTTTKAAPIAPKAGKQVASQATTTISQITSAEPYAYNAAGRRDPFAPIVQSEDKKATKSERPPLERYAVTEFKLTAVLWGGFGYNAMIEGPDSKGYFVKVGTVVGPNRGVVRKITQTKLIVEENYKSFSGEKVRKEFVIELRKKQEGMQ
jgi:type IV pilus assembly protein PilP